MLRIALIGVGIVTTALTGWLVKRRFFPATDGTPPVIIQMPQVFRPSSRRKKGERVELNPSFENGEGAADAGA
jgi:hypothetical protein